MKNFLKNTGSTALGVFFGLMLLWTVMEIYYSHSSEPKVMGTMPGSNPKPVV